MKKGFCLALGGLVACGGAAAPQPVPITVTATAPEAPQAQATPAPAENAISDGGASNQVEPPAAAAPDPQARSGPVTVTGRLSPEDIQSKMVPRMASFTACYKDALAENPTVSGTLRLRIVIDANGQVATANVTAPSTIKNDKMSRCVLKIVRSTPFPRPGQGTVEAMYSIVFAN